MKMSWKLQLYFLLCKIPISHFTNLVHTTFHIFFNPKSLLEIKMCVLSIWKSFSTWELFTFQARVASEYFHHHHDENPFKSRTMSILELSVYRFALSELRTFSSKREFSHHDWNKSFLHFILFLSIIINGNDEYQTLVKE